MLDPILLCIIDLAFLLFALGCFLTLIIGAIGEQQDEQDAVRSDGHDKDCQ
jgi:hypothetical protein